MFAIIKRWLSSFYLQYEMVTNIYMFEPWEKILINSLLIGILALVTFSSVVYLPKYTESLLQSFSLAPVVVSDIPEFARNQRHLFG